MSASSSDFTARGVPEATICTSELTTCFSVCGRCTVVCVLCRYSEESLCVITQDSMTVREIGEILCHVNTELRYLFSKCLIALTDLL